MHCCRYTLKQGTPLNEVKRAKTILNFPLLLRNNPKTPKTTIKSTKNLVPPAKPSILPKLKRASISAKGVVQFQEAERGCFF